LFSSGPYFPEFLLHYNRLFDHSTGIFVFRPSAVDSQQKFFYTEPTVEDDGSRFREVMTNHFTATRFLGMLI
jgi:hypothetical protein